MTDIKGATKTIWKSTANTTQLQIIGCCHHTILPAKSTVYVFLFFLQWWLRALSAVEQVYPTVHWGPLPRSWPRTTRWVIESSIVEARDQLNSVANLMTENTAGMKSAWSQPCPCRNTCQHFAYAQAYITSIGIRSRTDSIPSQIECNPTCSN